MNLEKAMIMLRERLGESAVIQDADMREYTSFRAGGRAAHLVLVSGSEELKYTLYVLGRVGVGAKAGCCGDAGSCALGSMGCNGCGKADGPAEYMVLGNGSNVLVRDSGYPGVIVKLKDESDDIEFDGLQVTAGAGVLLSSLAKAAAARELTGLEFAAGIPGSVGGACFMNAGAYGGEIKDVLKAVHVISKDGVRERILSPAEMKLSYRHSALMDSGDVVMKATFSLEPGDPGKIRETMQDFARRRSEKQPLVQPSAGSFFKRPEGHFAGALIEKAGLKGLSVGGAQVSPKHAGFIVNTGGATASDIEALMHLVQSTVYDESGVRLEPEVRIIG